MFVGFGDLGPGWEPTGQVIYGAKGQCPPGTEAVSCSRSSLDWETYCTCMVYRQVPKPASATVTGSGRPINVSPVIQTSISPQISPVFQQAFQPQNAPMTAGTTQTAPSTQSGGQDLSMFKTLLEQQQAEARRAAEQQAALQRELIQLRQESERRMAELVASLREKPTAPVQLGPVPQAGAVMTSAPALPPAPQMSAPPLPSPSSAPIGAGGSLAVPPEMLERSAQSSEEKSGTESMASPKTSSYLWAVLALGAVGIMMLSKGKRR